MTTANFQNLIRLVTGRDFSIKTTDKNTSLDTIKQVFGDKPKFKINQIVCYSSGDSTRTVFEN